MGNESSIESAATRYAESKGVWTRKFTSPAHRAVPDRVYGWDYRAMWIEFKSTGLFPTEAQYDEIKEMRARHLYVTWADNLEDAKKLIDYLVAGDWINLINTCERQNWIAYTKLYPDTLGKAPAVDEPEIDDLI